MRRHYLVWALGGCLLLGACGGKEETGGAAPYAVYSGSLAALRGPADEVELVKNFPKAFYQVFSFGDEGSFYVDNRVDIIKNQLRSGQVWEADFHNLMRHFAKPGSTVLDIGAHIGTHTVALSKMVGEDGKVIAFEPQKKIYSELVNNLELNGCHNVTAYRCALGDRFAEIEMNPTAADNEGGASIGKGGDAARMITLDSLNLNNISFLKMDVEDFEYYVLHGAEQTIRRNKPVMIIEVMGAVYIPTPDRQERIQQTLRYIESLGYTTTFIPGSWSDWLAVPNNDKAEA